MRWIGDGSVRDRAQTQAALDRFRELVGGAGLRAVRRGGGRCPGRLGRARSCRGSCPRSCRRSRSAGGSRGSAWGRGLATEGARAVLTFAFDDVGLDRVVSVCHVENTASERVMTKLGMRKDRDTVVPSSGVPVHVYAIDRA